MDKLTDLLLHTQRGGSTQRKSLTIIDPDKLHEFFVYLDESSLPDTIKAILATMLSGGLRVSEALSLRRCDLDLDNEVATVTVLKKANFRTSKTTGKKLKCEKVRREFPLHPIAIKYLKRQQKGKRHFGKIFEMSRNLVWRKCREFHKNFCPHSLRHSHISSRLHAQNESVALVADVIKIDAGTVASYNHINLKKVNKGYWRK
jgi:integrase